MPPPRTAKSDRLLLEPINIDKHLHDCHAIRSEPRSAEWSTHPPHTSLEETREWILEKMSSVEYPMWAIMLPNTSSTLVTGGDEAEGETQAMKLIGIIGLANYPDNIGYKVHPDYWGKGYMTEALKLFVEMFWTLEEKKSLSQIIGAYTPGNHASGRVLEKAGFKKGELLRERIELWFNRGKNRKSDIQCMYIDRPGSSE